MGNDGAYLRVERKPSLRTRVKMEALSEQPNNIGFYFIIFLFFIFLTQLINMSVVQIDTQMSYNQKRSKKKKIKLKATSCQYEL